MNRKARPKSWVEAEQLWKGSIPDAEWDLLQTISGTFDDEWLAKQVFSLESGEGAHIFYQWLFSPMGGHGRLLRLAEGLRLLTQHAKGTSWESKVPYLLKRLKGYSPEQYFGFLDVEFEVFQLAKMVARGPTGVTLLDLEAPLPSGKGADALVAVGSKRIYQEFRALGACRVNGRTRP